VEQTPGTVAVPGVVRLETVKQAYEATAADSSKASLSFDELLQSSELEEKLEANKKYTTRLMATKEDSPTGHLFINGKHFPMGGVSGLNRLSCASSSLISFSNGWPMSNRSWRVSCNLSLSR
jgi:hypothetical protein